MKFRFTELLDSKIKNQNSLIFPVHHPILPTPFPFQILSSILNTGDSCQHGFELNESTDTQIFKNKYLSFSTCFQESADTEVDCRHCSMAFYIEDLSIYRSRYLWGDPGTNPPQILRDNYVWGLKIPTRIFDCARIGTINASCSRAKYITMVKKKKPSINQYVRV